MGLIIRLLVFSCILASKAPLRAAMGVHLAVASQLAYIFNRVSPNKPCLSRVANNYTIDVHGAFRTTSDIIIQTITSWPIVDVQPPYPIAYSPASSLTTNVPTTCTFKWPATELLVEHAT